MDELLLVFIVYGLGFDAFDAKTKGKTDRVITLSYAAVEDILALLWLVLHSFWDVALDSNMNVADLNVDIM